jgi:hypothetical protein
MHNDCLVGHLHLLVLLLGAIGDQGRRFNLINIRQIFLLSKIL